MTTKLIFTVDYEDITHADLKKIAAWRDAYEAIYDIKAMLLNAMENDHFGNREIKSFTAYELLEEIETRVCNICKDYL